MRFWAILPAVAVAAVCGYLLGRAGTSPVAPAQVPVFAAAASTNGTPSPDVDLARIQQAYVNLQATAERLEAAAAALKASPAATPPATARTTADARSIAESDAASSLANETVNIALSKHTWGPEDAQAFRRSLPDLPPAERDRLIRKLLTAINSGQVQVTVRGAPF